MKIYINETSIPGDATAGWAIPDSAGQIYTNNRTDGARILASGIIDSATIAATSEAYTIANVQDEQPSKKWRSADLSDQTIDIDFGQSELMSCIVLYNHNLTADATIQITLSENADYSTPLYNVIIDGLLPEFGLGEYYLGMDGLGGYVSTDGTKYAIDWFNLTVARYARLIISDPTNADGYMEFGRLKAGPYIEPAISVSPGAGMTVVDESALSRSRSGALRSENKPVHRDINFTWNFLTDFERTLLINALNDVGKRSDMFISIYPEESTTREIENSVIGRMVDYSVFTHDHETAGGSYHTFSGTIGEAL